MIQGDIGTRIQRERERDRERERGAKTESINCVKEASGQMGFKIAIIFQEVNGTSTWNWKTGQMWSLRAR